VTVTVSSGTGHVKDASGNWVTSYTFTTSSAITSKSFTVRGVTDTSDVVFTVEVEAEDGSSLGTLTLTLTD